MAAYIHHRIRMLLEETSDAFGADGPVNADYAEYATLALSEFKLLLKNPHLTPRQLSEILRAGMFSFRATEEKNEKSWVSFMADHIQRSSNSNERHEA